MMAYNFNYDFKLEEIRKAKGLSRKQLAEKSGVNESTIKFLEYGINNPYEAKLSTLRSIANALKCKVRDFFPCEKDI